VKNKWCERQPVDRRGSVKNKQYNIACLSLSACLIKTLQGRRKLQVRAVLDKGSWRIQSYDLDDKSSNSTLQASPWDFVRWYDIGSCLGGWRYGVVLSSSDIQGWL
jgi:hypothetical protein